MKTRDVVFTDIPQAWEAALHMVRDITEGSCSQAARLAVTANLSHTERRARSGYDHVSRDAQLLGGLLRELDLSNPVNRAIVRMEAERLSQA